MSPRGHRDKRNFRWSAFFFFFRKRIFNQPWLKFSFPRVCDFFLCLQIQDTVFTCVWKCCKLSAEASWWPHKLLKNLSSELSLCVYLCLTICLLACLLLSLSLTHIHTHTHIRRHTHTHAHTHTRTHIHTHTHTHTHTQSVSPSVEQPLSNTCVKNPISSPQFRGK